MKGASRRLMFGAFLLIATASAQALKAPEVDLRDPTLWEEKKVNPLNDISVPCEVANGPDCPIWEDQKSDIQRERERREQKRWQSGYEHWRKY
ncbi:hypothetical protein ACYDHR_11000 [Klebsiella aerogenes]|jgi:hypothetical protein|uniref:hypothetical protein n=1 Tax=Klebsiella TaxID=570 RepID=UPI0004A00F20|nr:hypothetical protein [Klebsiella aerogenes]EIV2481710.1 hypothetical protein [Klebsiella aerogenes]EIV5803555.1 hypothetical protein [Klebsiella aerogenes]EIX9082805.1 hypothetical protein [Klebsiella aerogenes]EJL5445225.1 hypothetical protein [Klebsiella aerogenes]EKY1833459.1 hypothetical protein [Klebsiella aerogenes]